MLVQLPGTLPFEGITPHDGKGLQNLSNCIGKLRIMKSGKVVMRLMKEESTYVDLEVEKGIQAGFYQELVKIDSEN